MGTNLDKLDGLAARYCQLRDEIKTETTEKDALSSEMKTIVEKDGQVCDEKGSRFLDTNNYRIARNIRVGFKPTEDALSILKGISLEILRECAPRKVDVALVTNAFTEGRITEKQLRKILEKNPIPAVEVTPLAELKKDESI